MSDSSPVSGLSEASGVRLSWVEVPQESPKNLKPRKKYYFSEASKYTFLSTCSTLGFYKLTKSCILKSRIHGGFGDLKVSRKSEKSGKISKKREVVVSTWGKTAVVENSLFSPRKKKAFVKPRIHDGFGDLKVTKKV